MKIGNVQLDNEVFLSPMAGVTDLPFRTICKEKGCGMLYTEMINAKALCYDDENTKKMLNLEDDGHPVAVQIFGSDPEYMGKAASIMNQYTNDILDINMGCPAPKVVKNGDGSKLLLDLEMAEKIIKSVVANSKRPVTLKFRKGWDNNNIVACEIAKIAEKNGISAITIHGRTRDEFYTGHADWNIIKKVKESVNIPVIGNGDIVDEESAKAMFEYTGVDGIMIGRGAMGNPWIFKQIKHYLKTGERLPKTSKQEKYKILKEHIELDIKYKGEGVALNEMRKHISWYTKNMPDSSSFRNEINHIITKEELLKKINEYFFIL